MRKRAAIYVANKGFVMRVKNAVSAPVFSPDPQAAHVWGNLRRAERVAEAIGGCTVECVIWYGPHMPHGVFPQ